MDRIDGTLFDLNSIELAFFPEPYNLTLTGTLGGGGTVETTLSVASSPVNYLLGSAWDGLTSVSFSSDNPVSATILQTMNADVVPIPAAVWLFGSALAGLGWMKRKQTV
jgi:hypothetical protein